VPREIINLSRGLRKEWQTLPLLRETTSSW